MPVDTHVRARWDARIGRAQELISKHSAVANALRLYLATLEFQAEIASRFEAPVNPGLPLRRQIDLSAVVSVMPTLVTIAAERGPDQLRFEAHKMRQLGEERWRPLVEEVLGSAEPVPLAAYDFFARACLQPLAENLQLQFPKDPNYGQNVCPACGGLPQLAIVRPEKEKASRSLLCSFCLCEWPFPQPLCPLCGEEDQEKLPHYKSEEWTYVRVEACDNCQHYLKTVDMTIDGSAVPLVDEAALAVLDVWATGLGYTKIIRNLIGF
ncbi:MAG TPA: formate dehydrogenase accessory protein FdhE [Candidatus Sulfotelmatobacter sp.]|nr:formate dehydrogenase accessory protein FdhE [Candidatus Sulfotelmatobacter sp.]